MLFTIKLHDLTYQTELDISNDLPLIVNCIDEYSMYRAFDAAHASLPDPRLKSKSHSNVGRCPT